MTEKKKKAKNETILSLCISIVKKKMKATDTKGATTTGRTVLRTPIVNGRTGYFHPL